MKKLIIFFLLIGNTFCSVYAQKDTLFYTYNNIPVSTFKECRTYGVLEYKSPDSVQVIETKFRKDGDVLSRTFYIDFKNQIKHGQQMFWNKDMKLAVTKNYFNDTLQGYTKYYSEIGVLEKEQAYIDGVLVNDTAFVEIDEAEFTRKNLAEYMPIFPGCESILDDRKRNRCSNDSILKAIQSNAKSTAKSRELGIQGIVVARFLIDTKGNVSELKIIEGMPNGEDLMMEVIKSVMALPVLTPGTQLGEEVSVQFTVPVKFRLDKGYMEELRPNTLYDAGRYSFAQKELRERGIYTQGVDRMPIWKGCHLKGIEVTEDDCTEWRIQKHIRKNVIYPVSLKKDKPSAIVVVNFKVTEEGKVEDVLVLERSNAIIYEEMQKEAERVIKSIPDFIPAKKEGKPVSFQMSVAVKFNYQTNLN